MPTLFALIFVVILLLVGTASWGAYRVLFGATREAMLRQLETGIQDSSADAPRSPILRSLEKETGGFLASIQAAMKSLGTRAASAGLGWNGEAIILASLGLAVAGGLLGWIFPLLIFRGLTSAVLAIALGLLPIGIISYHRAKRMKAFEEQFPEALDFIARALRAGHAFSVSLEMIADESPEPLGAEFRRVFQELNLGAPMESTLVGLTERVPLVDVKFFSSAVLLQREAGGNLSEILTNLAHTVRERFKLKGHIVAATAHARITAMILSILPLVTLVGLQMRSPDYVKGFVTEPEGAYLLIGALFGQLAGYLLMRKLINFRI